MTRNSQISRPAETDPYDILKYELFHCCFPNKHRVKPLASTNDPPASGCLWVCQTAVDPQTEAKMPPRGQKLPQDLLCPPPTSLIGRPLLCRMFIQMLL